MRSSDWSSDVCSSDLYKRRIDEFGHTQEALGRLVHKSRSHVANLLRLLDLPEKVRGYVASGELDMGHARALIKSDDPEALALEVINRDLSVRETEKLVRAGKPKKPRPGPVAHKDAHADIEALARQLGDRKSTRLNSSHSCAT